MATSTTSPIFLLLIAALCLCVALLGLRSTVPRLSALPTPLAAAAPAASCPVVLYNKQFKTGSTVISNVLYRTSAHYGCRNVDCGTQKKLMKGTTAHVGAIGGLTMTCHSMEWNHRLVSSLRAAYRHKFVYVASVREPISWFKSAAFFFYKLEHKNVTADEMWTEQFFKICIDWLLLPEHNAKYQDMLFRTLGMSTNVSDAEMFQKFLSYDIIIDHAHMDEGLQELGALTGWQMLPCTNAKRLTYRGASYDTYRADEIKQATKTVGRMYSIASKIRQSRRSTVSASRLRPGMNGAFADSI